MSFYGSPTHDFTRSCSDQAWSTRKLKAHPIKHHGDMFVLDMSPSHKNKLQSILLHFTVCKILGEKNYIFTVYAYVLYIYIDRYMCIALYVHTYIYIYTLCIHIYIYIYISVCVAICVCICWCCIPYLHASITLACT